MRKFFTKLLVIVFLVGLVTHGFAAGPPLPALPTGVTSVWPPDNSVGVVVPGTGNTFVMKFNKDLQATVPNTFGAAGVFGLLKGTAATGYQQVETIQYGIDGSTKVIRKDARTVEIKFAVALDEDGEYHITINDRAIRFADGQWMAAVGYDPFPGNPDWNFTVKDVTKPLMVNCVYPDPYPGPGINPGTPRNVNGKFAVSVLQNPIVICFNEPVQWKSNANPYAIGKIAAYTAQKSGLDPNAEFGGDVIYERPARVDYYIGSTLVSSVNVDDLKSVSVTTPPAMFTQMNIYFKEYTPNQNDNLTLKYAAIGPNIWPTDRDIYIRLADSLLVDKGGNSFAGIGGSPFDTYSLSTDKYWFSTRTVGDITCLAYNIYNDNSFADNTNTAIYEGTHADKMYWNDDVVVEITSDDLGLLSGAAVGAMASTASASDKAAATVKVKQFIKLTIGTTNIDYSVKEIAVDLGGNTKFLLEPGDLKTYHLQTLKVEVLGGVIQDKGDLRQIGACSHTIDLGDFLAPAIAGSVNNELCTNFDLRITSNEFGKTYYAIIKKNGINYTSLAKPSGIAWGQFPSSTVTANDIVNGYTYVDVTASDGKKYRKYYFFYHVDEGLPYGFSSTTQVAGVEIAWNNTADPKVPPTGPTPGVAANWVPDVFDINSSFTAFEKVLDFTLPNNGDQYDIFYFALDPKTADNPINNSPAALAPLVYGVTTGVSYLPVQLTDCNDPVISWVYKGKTLPTTSNTADVPNRNIWDDCTITTNPDLLAKKGEFKIRFNEKVKKVDNTKTWNELIKLEWASTNSFPGTSIMEFTVTEYNNGGVDSLLITPVNSYPSGSWVKATLSSGAIEDLAGNVINIETSCTKQVESYDDPRIQVLAVKAKAKMFPDVTCKTPLVGTQVAPGAVTPRLGALAVDDSVAVKNGAITVIFNNPMFSPRRDETTYNMLLPLSYDVNALNYVGKYVKLREGTATGAEVTNNIATAIPLTYEMYDAAGALIPSTSPNTKGVKKIVATHNAEYKSEYWYYAEVEETLLDENRVPLDTVDNNEFKDLHKQYVPQGISCTTSAFVSTLWDNDANYFARFLSEDTEAPELRFVFEKIIDNWPTTPNLNDRIWPYITPLNEDLVNCINPYKQGPGNNEAPVGAIITEWSKLGFDPAVANYYINTDPNGLRPYFILKDGAGNVLPFDVVVLNVFTPTAVPVPGIEDYTRDAVWFGFVPFEGFKEGETYNMTFNPNYRAPGSALSEGAVFVDDNGNKVVADTYVAFNACSAPTNCFDGVVSTATFNVDCNDVRKTVSGTLTPNITLAFERIVDDVDLLLGYSLTPYVTISDGVNTWRAHNSTLFLYNDVNGKSTVTIPWASFLQVVPVLYPSAPGLTLAENTQYTVTLGANTFVDRNNEDFGNCVNSTYKFWSPDATAPAVVFKSPDIDADQNNNLGQSPFAIDPRNPGLLIIGWNEPVTAQSGKIIQVWQNPTTRRIIYDASEATVYPWPNATNPTQWRWEIELPADFLQFSNDFHVDVEAGFVKDCYSNSSVHLTGNVDGPNTWTWRTDSDLVPALTGFTPKCNVEAGNMVNEITLTFSEGVVPVAGKKLYVRLASGGSDLYVTDVNAMTGSNGNKTWTINAALPVVYNGEYKIFVQTDAFKASWPANSTATTPSAPESWLACNTNSALSFKVVDLNAPFVKIWPVNGDVKVPFNAHGYVKFSEKLRAVSGSNIVILGQNNIKNWIKVWYDDPTTPLVKDMIEAPSTMYVVEFVNLDRTHMRVTFQDPGAPSINGTTYNMRDEWYYEIRVVPTPASGTYSGYTLQDYNTNVLAAAVDYPLSSEFKTEDITAPNFYVTTCVTMGEEVTIRFTPENVVNPYVNQNGNPIIRTYPKEKGIIYYKVLPSTATAPNAAWLFANGDTAKYGNQEWAWGYAERKVSISEIESDARPPYQSTYNYTVYAVMQDEEYDIFAKTSTPAFGAAWVINEGPFVQQGDTDPNLDAIGFADIRPAPNKNTTPKYWNFCFCDDDRPEVIAKEKHTEINVPVGEQFDILFDELVKFSGNVIETAEGTGVPGVPPTNSDYGYEVRLREWDNNVAVPIKVAIIDSVGNTVNIVDPVFNTNTQGRGFRIMPQANLKTETRYYVEIDRMVIQDVPNSNCDADNSQVPGNALAQCAGCSTTGNYFRGWIGRDDWNFTTQDNVRPILTKVTPTGCCVKAEAPLGQITFTFKEKNQMMINESLKGQKGSIYIYKDNDITVPHEIINPKSANFVRLTSDTWSISYTPTHVYQSYTRYYVLWNDSLFVDNAAPKQTYTESLTEVEPYNESHIPDPLSWDRFFFTTEDILKPVANWAFMNQMWGTTDGLMMPLANGARDMNDNLSLPKDVCTMYEVPQQVSFFVWFDETVVLKPASPNTIQGTEGQQGLENRRMAANFWLKDMAGNSVTIKWEAQGTAGVGGKVIGGLNPVTIPEGKQWYKISAYNNATTPVSTLASSGKYKFGIIGNAVSDVPDEFSCHSSTTPLPAGKVNCKINTLPETELFNFCVWDAVPAQVSLWDGIDVEVTKRPATTTLPSGVDKACVADRTYFDLKFTNPVVKTVDVPAPYPFVAPPGSPLTLPWWSYSNLLLTQADLMNTTGNHIIYFHEIGNNDSIVEIASVEIKEAGKWYRLNLKKPLRSEGKYEFIVKANKLKDLNYDALGDQNPVGNFLPEFKRIFTIWDYTSPYITNLVPTDGAINVDPGLPLLITFNERVKLGTKGARIIVRDNGNPQGIKLNLRSDDPIVRLVGGSTINGSTASTQIGIFHTGLAPFTKYYVEIENGFVYDEDCKNEDFAKVYEQGLIDDSWSFTTNDGLGPIAQLSPLPGQKCVGVDENLIITFNENVTILPYSRAVIYKVLPQGSFHNPLWPDALFGDVVHIQNLSLPANYPSVKLTGTDVVNGLDKNRITITVPEELWESGATYYVRIEGDGVNVATEAPVINDFAVPANTWKYPVSHQNAPGITLLPGIHQNQWYFTIGDVAAPQLVSTTPVRGATVAPGVASAVTDLTMTFDREVRFGTGTFKVYEFIVNPNGGVANQAANLWKTYNVPADVTSGKITLSDDKKTVTIKDVQLLDGINWYYVLAEPGVVTNDIVCTLTKWAGILNPDTWLFKTDPDVIRPTLTASTVTSTACDLVYLNPGTVAMSLTFSEPVSVARGTGTVQIKDGVTVVATATITAAKITGNVVNLVIGDFLVPSLVDGKDYTIVIGSNAIHDRATASLTLTQNPFGKVPVGNENWFAGVTLPFKTGDFTRPALTNWTPNGNMYLENNVTMVATFSEPVEPGTGKLKVYNAVTDALVGEFMASQDEDTNPLTVTLSKMLPDETSYYVLIDEGFVKDMVYMNACDAARLNLAVTSKTAWTIGIDDNTIPAITDDNDATNLMKTFDIVLEYNDVISSVDFTKAQLMSGGAPVIGVTNAVIGTDPTTVIVSVTVTQDQASYMLSLDPGFVNDNAYNPNASAAEMAGPYAVGDRTKPVVEIPKLGPTGILGSYHTPPVVVTVDYFDDSALTIEKPITITKDGIVVATWTPASLNADQAASFNPALWFGTYTVNIPAGAVKDPNGNENDAYSWSFSIIDNSIADNCGTIINPVDGTACVGKSIDLKMKFCERIAAGNPLRMVRVYEILEVQGQLAENRLFYSTPVTSAMISMDMLTIPVTGLRDRTSYIVLVDAGAITDEAGNAWIGIADPTVWNFTTGDNTAPTVAITPNSANNPNNFTVTAVFSEEVLGANSLIVVTNAKGLPSITTTDNKFFSIAITAADKDTVTVTVPTTITDKNTGCTPNALAAQVVGTYIVGDNTAPEVSITSEPAVVNNTPRNFNVVLTFSEPVSGVKTALAGSTGLVDAVSTNNIVWTVSMTGADETAVRLVLDKTLVSDLSLNMNKLAAGLDKTYTVGDFVAPTALVEPEAKADIRDNVMNVKVTFSEEVLTPAGGIVVTGGTGVVTKTAATVYNVAITANDNATVTLDLTALITDDSYNKNAFAPKTYTYGFGDRTGPTVVVTKPGAKDTINTFDVTIVFNEKVTGVNLSSVTVTGSKLAKIVSLDPIVDGLAYEATLTGADGDELMLKLSEAIKDLSGNPFKQIATYKYTIADKKAPTVVANPATGVNLENSNMVWLKFSEDVLNVETGVKVTGAETSTVVMVSDSLYKVTYTALDLATVTITVPATVVDLKGNAIVPVTWTYKIDDNTAPFIASVSPASAVNAENTIVAVVTFSEPVNGAATGITVTGGTSFTVSGVDGDKVYTVTMNGADLSTLVMTIPTTIKDRAGIPNALAAGGTYTYVIDDNIAPTLVSATAPAAPLAKSFEVVLVFSEPVTGVTQSVIGFPVTTTDDKTYKVAVSGNEKQTVKIMLPSSIKDKAGNPNAFAGTELSYTIGDFTAPKAVVDPASGVNMPNSFKVMVTFDEPVKGVSSGITATGGTVTTVKVNDVAYELTVTGADKTTVTVKIPNTIVDMALVPNAYAGSTHTYEIGDNTKPLLVKADPAAAKDTINKFDVTLVFNEEVIIPAGAITVNAPATVTAPVKLFDGNVYSVTINAPDKSVVTLTLSNMITDASINKNKFDGKTFTYSIGDHLAPTLVTWTPKGDLGDVKTVDLVMNFSENVVKGTGSVQIYSGSTLFKEIPIASAVVAGTKVTIAGVAVEKAKQYFVLVAAGALKDEAGNAFAGVNSPAAWPFEIGDFAIDATIAQIQGTGDKSPLAGELVNTSGTITGVSIGEGFYMQDANAAWSGVWVAYSNTTGLQIGNGVKVTGNVSEIANVTTISATSVALVIPSVAITPIVMANPTEAEAEKYESVLVKVQKARATAADAGNGEWSLYYQATDNVIVNDLLYAYTPVSGNWYTVTGIINARLDSYKLEPRMLSDIINLTVTNVGIVDAIEYKVYPNPFKERIFIDNNDKLTRVVITNVAGQRVIDVQNPSHEIRTNNLVSGVYVITLLNDKGIVKTEKFIRE